MRIALVFNLKRSYSDEEAEYDVQYTIDDIAEALASTGDDVVLVEASRRGLLARLKRAKPDLVFNIAEGVSGSPHREAVFPVLYEQLGLPYTGSSPYVLTVTLDKWWTKQVAAVAGIATPRGFTARSAGELVDRYRDLEGLWIVKPNYEGSSKGITDTCVVQNQHEALEVTQHLLARYGQSVLVEQFVEGVDVTVPWIEGVTLPPAVYEIDVAARSRFNLYDSRLKGPLWSAVTAKLAPTELVSWFAIQTAAERVFRALDVRDFGRADFRVAPDGSFYLLEVNALPSLERDAGEDGRQNLGVFNVCAARYGMTYQQVIRRIVQAACSRLGLGV